LDQNLHVVSRIGGSGLKGFLFDCRSREVPSVEGSCEHVSHPLGGDRVVDRWRKHRAHRKGGSRRQVVAYRRHLGRGQPIADLSCFGDFAKEEHEGFNTPTREVASCE
jgi:hypothetical protein